MSNRYLIINADDFGLCKETNDAVEHLFNEGRITSTTVMVPGKESKDAINRAKSSSRIKMGLHITLNSDFCHEKWQSAAPSGKVPSLLDEDSKLFYDVDCLYKNAKGNEVAIEINAQYDFVMSLGYRPTHADSHCGTLYGLSGRPFLKEAYEFCAKHKLPFRFPKSKTFIISKFGGNVPREIDTAHTGAVAFAEKMGISLLTDMVTNPFDMKDIPSYDNLKEFYLSAIRNIKEGVTELFLHPSGNNRDFMLITSNWQKRIWEYQFLLDDDMMKTIELEGIKLVSWDNAPFDKF